MLVIVSFIFILGAGVSILLITNKSQTAEEIKAILGQIYKNLKDLFMNIKELAIILKNLIKENIQEKNTPEDESKNNENKDVEIKSSSKQNNPITKVLEESDSQDQSISSNEPSPVASKEDEAIATKGPADSELSPLETKSEHPPTSLDNNSEEINTEISDKKEDIS